MIAEQMMNVNRVVLIKSLRVSLVVGSILVLINHFEVLSGHFTTTRIAQIILCYAVPFGVSCYSQITTIRKKPSDPGISLDGAKKG